MTHPRVQPADPADPHGFHDDGHHGHVIVPWQILLGVLLALLFFTALTVFQAQFEKHAAYEWGWEIPRWVNVVLAMGIATVKGTLVVMYFMQLRYDKGLNVLLFLFTLFAVWLFIMYTAMDLQNRGMVTDWRSGEVQRGGTGVGFGSFGFAEGREDIKSGTGPIYERVKQNYITNHGIDHYLAHESDSHHGAHAETVSDAWHSRPREGLTPGLFAGGVWEELKEPHDEHNLHPDPDHDGDHTVDEAHEDVEDDHDEDHPEDDHAGEDH